MPISRPNTSESEELAELICTSFYRIPILQILLRPLCTTSLINDIGSSSKRLYTYEDKEEKSHAGSTGSND